MVAPELESAWGEGSAWMERLLATANDVELLSASNEMQALSGRWPALMARGTLKGSAGLGFARSVRVLGLAARTDGRTLNHAMRLREFYGALVGVPIGWGHNTQPDARLLKTGRDDTAFAWRHGRCWAA